MALPDLCRFDHSDNQLVNAALSRNITGLMTIEVFTPKQMTRACKTYFRSLKRDIREKLAKCTARKKVLNEFTTFDKNRKAKVMEVLVTDTMSSDESVVQSDEDDREDSVAAPKKYFVKHPLRWRSPELTNYTESLDTKIQRHRTARGKQMVVPVREGNDSSRTPPEACPEWAFISDWAQ
uniref:Uncharacterized protein n=1 Tax=Amphimedon queenslandica TaxID=400682 RepID=A0A1X7TTA7_AMPQE